VGGFKKKYLLHKISIFGPKLAFFLVTKGVFRCPSMISAKNIDILNKIFEKVLISVEKGLKNFDSRGKKNV
jgi:hypothetical protein